MILQILTYSEADITEFRDFYTLPEFIFGFYIDDPETVDGELYSIVCLLIAGQWVSVKQEPHLVKLLTETFKL